MYDSRKQKALKRVKESEQEAIENVAAQNAAQARLESSRAIRRMLDDETGLNEQQKQFLTEYALCGIVTRAAMNTGMGYKRHYAWLKHPEYAEVFEECRKIADERLELLAYDLASGVYSKPIVNMGEIVTYEPIYDTKLLHTLLKARMPNKYREKIDVTSNGHSIVKMVDKEAWESV